MAPSTAMKRPASDRMDTAIKRVKTEEKACISCEATGTTFPKVSINCRGAHANDVCKHCWNKYFNTTIVAQASSGIKCVQCPAKISDQDLKRILSRKNREHYEWLVRRAQAEQNGERECLGDYTDAYGHKITCHYFYELEDTTDGRVYDCKKCGNRECTQCGVREHKGETCEQFRKRLQVTKAHEEAATAKAFMDGYYGKEHVRASGNTKMRFKRPKPCPSCGILIEREDKCGHMTCVKCGNQFCINCDAPYYGKDSVPELGNKAHKPDCSYFHREYEDRRFKRRVKKAKGDADEKSDARIKDEQSFGEV